MFGQVMAFPAELAYRFAAAAFVALAVAAASAASADGAAASSMQFSLHASNGYTLQVKTEGEQALISLSQSDSAGRASVTYFVSDSVSADVIDADLGPLGRINVHFTRTGQTRTIHLHRGPIPPGCRAPRRLVRSLGDFEGSISIRGENGYASVDATQASGTIGPSARRICGPSAAVTSRAGAPHLPDVEHIWARSDAILSSRNPSSREKPNSTWFLAWTSGAAVRYLAERFEIIRPGLAIRRSAIVAGPKTGFSYRADLSRATLRPPAPFSGEATFSNCTDRLSGDLAVELPGSAPERLTGSAFEAWIDATR